MTATPTIEDLRRERNILGGRLVHDCDPRSESCHCFGQADVDAYERVTAALRAAEAGAS